MIIPKVIRVQETQIKMCGYSDLELKCDTLRQTRMQCPCRQSWDVTHRCDLKWNLPLSSHTFTLIKSILLENFFLNSVRSVEFYPWAACPSCAYGIKPGFAYVLGEIWLTQSCVITFQNRKERILRRKMMRISPLKKAFRNPRGISIFVSNSSECVPNKTS